MEGRIEYSPEADAEREIENLLLIPGIGPWTAHYIAMRTMHWIGHNPISIIIPCHRVVGTNGSLTGYASGLDRKIRLLKLEGVDLSPFHRPTKGTAL